MIEKKPFVHFIGIGGIGMSSLAQYYRSQNFSASGSDMAASRITDLLKKDGVAVKIGHKKGNLPLSASLVVISQAIRPQNPELIEAKRLGVRVLTYPEAVGELTDQYRTVAIAGAHGKSTTTALAALELIRGGFDPTVILGVLIDEFGGRNFRAAKSRKLGKKEKWLVLEADEFGRAFLEYSPSIAIVTNVDREHLDIYKNIRNVKRAFLAFFSNVKPGGTLILNRDDKNLYSLCSSVLAIAKKRYIRVIWYSLYDKRGSFSAVAAKIKKIIKISGEHNLSNAMAVYDLGKLLKIPESKILSAIGSYRGAWRRMEYRGKYGASLVYDDYAHHPSEIKATQKAFKEKFSGAPLICVFQPHQAKRLQALFKEFISAFTDADALVLIPSYKVAGRDESYSKFTAEHLAASIIKKYPKRRVYYLADPSHIKKTLARIIPIVSRVSSPAPVIILMGAGDIVQYSDSLIK